MEIWFVITITGCIGALLWAFITTFITKPISKYPPGPNQIPILSRILWVRKTSTEAESALRILQSKFGPIISVVRGSRPLIFITSRTLAYEALVLKGAIFADRPKTLPTQKVFNSDQHNISSSGYGPTWRILRRNLTSQMMHSSTLRKYSHARKWVLGVLMNELIKARGESNDGVVKVMDHFRFAMFCLLVLMCFGDKLDEDRIKEIEMIQTKVLFSFRKFQILNLWPRVMRVILRGRWNELYRLRNEQEKVLIRHIRARKSATEKDVVSYVDTLLSIELQENEKDGLKRKLNEGELVTACSEFLNAGTDTTSTALQWTMANLVKYPEIQQKIFEEIKGVIGSNVEEIDEDQLSKLHYLKAVVMESLRRHPPAHFVLPHTVTREVELGGYIIPKNAVINFTVAEMGWDPKVWEDPMEFKPERFLSDGEKSFDITGSREIKMMPFGVGRRICPGFGLAMLHLEYFVANLVWKLKWESVDEVDLSEKQEFTTVMKYPLKARISPRQTTE